MKVRTLVRKGVRAVKWGEWEDPPEWYHVTTSDHQTWADVTDASYREDCGTGGRYHRFGPGDYAILGNDGWPERVLSSTEFQTMGWEDAGTADS